MQLLNALAEIRTAADRPNKVNAVKTDQLVVDVVYFTAGQAQGWFRHPDADRILVVLKGEGAVHVEAASPLHLPLQAGVVCLVPRGAWHRVEAKTELVLAQAVRFPYKLEERG